MYLKHHHYAEIQLFRLAALVFRSTVAAGLDIDPGIRPHGIPPSASSNRGIVFHRQLNSHTCPGEKLREDVIYTQDFWTTLALNQSGDITEIFIPGKL